MPDDVTKMLEASGVAVTRDNYILMAWGDDIVDEWTPGHEAELPEELQDWSRYEVSGEDIVLKPGAEVVSPAPEATTRIDGLAKSLASLETKVADLAPKAPAAEPVVINVSAPEPAARRKTITIRRDKDGNTVADVVEHEQEKP